MGEVTCTINYKEKDHRDLVLPDNIPAHLLANSVALALGLPVGERLFYELLSLEKDSFVRIQGTRTLQQAYVTNGDQLKLALELEEKDNLGYLVADRANRFKLRENNVIGRQMRENLVDIDLTPLDINTVVSRRHAIITHLNNRYLIKDAGSKNGTYINDARIPAEQSVTLQSKDVVYLGSPGKGVRLVFIMG